MNDQVLSIPQMQELIALGIDTSKASIYWGFPIVDHKRVKPTLVIGKGPHFMFIEEYIPTFTLQDILEMLPKTIEAYKDGSKLPLIITPTNQGNYAVVYDNPYYKNGKVGLQKSNSLLEAAFLMIKWCKQNNYV